MSERQKKRQTGRNLSVWPMFPSISQLLLLLDSEAGGTLFFFLNLLTLVDIIESYIMSLMLIMHINNVNLYLMPIFRKFSLLVE